MGFKFTEFIIESIIRDGLEDINNSLDTPNDKIEDVFSELRLPHLNKYYGDKAINEIKNQIRNYKKIDIKQTYPIQDADSPQIGIVLLSNRENEPYDAIDDFVEDVDTETTPTTIIESFDAYAYNSTTGMVDVHISDIDLSLIRIGYIFVDGDGNQYEILGGINPEEGSEHFFIGKGYDINLIGCYITNNSTTTREEIRGVRDTEIISIGIATKNQLMTKYLYTIVKYIILSNKRTLIERGVELSTFDGSDFIRTEQDMPNNVFARFLNITAKMLEHTWTASTPNIVDQFDESVILVKRDEFKRDGEDELTIRTVIDDT